MDRLQSMQIFCRVIDLNGFAAAARDLDLSPSVITRMINELEEHLGSRLINRTTRKLVLTEAGERYLEQVRRILADVAQVEAEVGSDTAEPRGVLKVLAPPAFASRQLAPALPRFRSQYPHISIEKRRGVPTQLPDLRQHDMISAKMPELTFCPVSGESGDGRGSVTIPLNKTSPVLSTGHIDTTYAATVAGLGVGGFPSYVVAQALAQGTLVRVLPQWKLFDLGIYAAIPSRRHLPARTRVFLDFLVGTFGGHLGTDPWVEAPASVQLA